MNKVKKIMLEYITYHRILNINISFWMNRFLETLRYIIYSNRIYETDLKWLTFLMVREGNIPKVQDMVEDAHLYVFFQSLNLRESERMYERVKDYNGKPRSGCVYIMGIRTYLSYA